MQLDLVTGLHMLVSVSGVGGRGVLVMGLVCGGWLSGLCLCRWHVWSVACEVESSERGEKRITRRTPNTCMRLVRWSTCYLGKVTVVQRFHYPIRPLPGAPLY